MTTLVSENIKKYLPTGRISAPVRSSASATSSLLRSVFAGNSAGTPTGKIVVSGNDYWIEVSQTPFANGFVKSTDLRILNEQKTEVFLSITQSGTTTYKIAFSTTAPTTTVTTTTQNISESQAKSELEQFIINDQNVFASLGRCQVMLKKIPSSVNVSVQENTLTSIINRYNVRQLRLANIKEFQSTPASHHIMKSIAALPPTPSSFMGLGAVPALVVPIVWWAVAGATALSIWLLIRNNKAEGLSDLKLSNDIEKILSEKLTEEERKKVVNEFETQRQQAFAEGKKNTGGTIGQLANLAKWGAIGFGVYFIVKKYS
jgi:hypothetical protein